MEIPLDGATNQNSLAAAGGRWAPAEGKKLGKGCIQLNVMSGSKSGDCTVHGPVAKEEVYA